MSFERVGVRMTGKNVEIGQIDKTSKGIKEREANPELIIKINPTLYFVLELLLNILATILALIP